MSEIERAFKGKNKLAEAAQGQEQEMTKEKAKELLEAKNTALQALDAAANNQGHLSIFLINQHLQAIIDAKPAEKYWNQKQFASLFILTKNDSLKTLISNLDEKLTSYTQIPNLNDFYYLCGINRST